MLINNCCYCAFRRFVATKYSISNGVRNRFVDYLILVNTYIGILTTISFVRWVYVDKVLIILTKYVYKLALIGCYVVGAGSGFGLFLGQSPHTVRRRLLTFLLALAGVCWKVFACFLTLISEKNRLKSLKIA